MVSILIKSNITTPGGVSALVKDFRDFNVAEGNYSPSEIDTVFGRFLAALTK